MIPLRDVIPSRTRPWVTMAIIGVNVLAFASVWGLDRRAFEAALDAWGLVPAEFRWPAVFSSMFMHGSVLHLAGNMLYLWIFGDNVEDRMGHGRFVWFYLLCGVGAALAQTFVAPESFVPMVGASGAVAGVMGAYFVLYPRSRVLTLFPFPLMVFEMPAIYLLGAWFAMQFVNGVGSLAASAQGAAGGGVAFWAHIAGFGVGAVLIFVFRRPDRQDVTWWDIPPTPRP